MLWAIPFNMINRFKCTTVGDRLDKSKPYFVDPCRQLDRHAEDKYGSNNDQDQAEEMSRQRGRGKQGRGGKSTRGGRGRGANGEGARKASFRVHRGRGAASKRLPAELLLEASFHGFMLPAGLPAEAAPNPTLPYRGKKSYRITSINHSVLEVQLSKQCFFLIQRAGLADAMRPACYVGSNFMWHAYPSIRAAFEAAKLEAGWDERDRAR